MKITHRDESNTKILGIDSSTTAIAWTLIEVKDGHPFPVKWGKIKLDSKKEMYDKLAIVGEEFPLLLSELDPHQIFVEKSIFVKNPDTARKLSMIVGGLMVLATVYDYPLTPVEPATWKSFTKYHNMSRKMVNSATDKLGKTEGKKFCDRMRKIQTTRVLELCFPEWDFDYDDHDIVDSCAIALYGVNEVSMAVSLVASLDDLVTPEELVILGL